MVASQGVPLPVAGIAQGGLLADEIDEAGYGLLGRTDVGLEEGGELPDGGHGQPEVRGRDAGALEPEDGLALFGQGVEGAGGLFQGRDGFGRDGRTRP